MTARGCIFHTGCRIGELGMSRAVSMQYRYQVVDFTAIKGTRARNYTNEVINCGKQMIESGRSQTRYNLGNVVCTIVSFLQQAQLHPYDVISGCHSVSIHRYMTKCWVHHVHVKALFSSKSLCSLVLTFCSLFRTRHVFVKHGCPRRQQSQNMAKSLSPQFWPHPQGHVMSVKCEQPFIDELTIQVWILYDHPNFKYCT